MASHDKSSTDSTDTSSSQSTKFSATPFHIYGNPTIQVSNLSFPNKVAEFLNDIFHSSHNWKYDVHKSNMWLSSMHIKSCKECKALN